MFPIVMWAWCISYVAGEIKTPNKAVFVASLTTIGVSSLLAIEALLGYGHMLGTEFQRAAAWNAFNGPVEGYTLPWDTSINGLVFMAWGQNAAIAVLYTATWVVAVVLMMVAITVFMQRVVFAWSMDRMAPRFLSEISPRYAAPMKGFAFLCGFGIVTMIIYTLVSGRITGSLVATGMIISTVFIATGISAIVFPYRKRCAAIWKASPYSQSKLFGIPVITIGGVAYVAFLSVLLYFQFVDSRTREITGTNLVLFLGIWAFGVAWYFIWRSRSRKAHLDVNLTMKELPPE